MGLTQLLFFYRGKVRHKFLCVLSTPVRLCRFLKNTEILHSHVATITDTLKDRDPIKLGSVNKYNVILSGVQKEAGGEATAVVSIRI